MTEICDSLRQPTLVKTEWICSASYQKLFAKAKLIIKEDTYMKIYDEVKPLYYKTDSSGVGFGAGLQQIRDGITVPKMKHCTTSY